MGHEIVYCYWCSCRILGTDFEKGSAILIGNHACCPQCLPKVLASLPDKQRETLLAELSRVSAPKPARITPRTGTNISSTRTPRAGSTVLDPAPRPKPPMVLFVIGGVVLALLVLLIVVMTGSSPEKTAVRSDPPPVPIPKPVGPDRERLARDAVQKARDAARSAIDIDLQVRLWDEAVAASERTASSDAATQERTLILQRRKEVYAQELQRLEDSVDGILRDDEFKKALEALAGARKRHDLPDWTGAIDRKIEDVKKLEAAGGPYRQGADPDGLVCIEAERFHHKIDVGEHAWTLTTQLAGYSGSGAVAALPNKGGQWLTKFLETSPRLDYRIRFVKPGRYAVWVRASAETDKDDSVHVGLDGMEVPSANAVAFGPSKKWIWTRRTMANKDAMLDVPTAGPHVLNVWMREDGAFLDRILLTTDLKYVPKDLGPAETSR
jgi:hypothetical protein